MKSYLIASYPRSGSTWLRFILCNLLYPLKGGHDFSTVNRYIPPLEDPAGIKIAIKSPQFYKTHSLRHGQNIIFLHRHVGDVLVSEWWYKKKFHNEQRTFVEYLMADDFGRGWREHVDFYFPCRHSIGYKDLSDPERVFELLDPLLIYAAPATCVEKAIQESTFDKMRAAESAGFGIYPTGNPDIKFVREGRTGQWQEALNAQLGIELIEKNALQLKLLGYL